ncbi:hypothetical protein ALMP_64430 [Streptomyces sp. A012304]|nr:hypothetical protein ALMP_64430 [Streptomyces sp. A012304]
MGRAITAIALAATLSAAGGADAPTRAGGVERHGCGLAPGTLTVADLPAGASVLECAAVGRLVTHGGAGVTVPEPGTKVSVDALTVDGSRHGFTLAVAEDGTVSYDLPHDTGTTEPGHAHAQAPAAGPVAGARAACADSSYAVADHKEYGTYDWWIGDDALPGGISRAEAGRAFGDAINTIITNRNDCGYGDGVGARAAYHSMTHHEADIDREARCQARDGFSVWDAGPLTSAVVATTCTWSRPVAGGPDWLKEADVRFNTGAYTFTNNPTGACTNAYDIRSVATHEAGHVFGLAHVGSGHEAQTMYTNSFVCTTTARTLGKGDVLGLRAIY